MEKTELTEEELIDFAQQHECPEITHWKLERWHKADIIPRPVVVPLGYGKGTRSTYPVHAAVQLITVCRLLEQTRKFDVVRFQLWHEGYDISLPLLRETIRQLVPQLRWKVPHREDPKYNAMARRLNSLFQKMSGPFFRLLLKQFGKDFENFRSFIEIQMSLLYGIHVLFEPSHRKGELSNAEIFARGLNLAEWRFLPKDLTADFQHMSDQGLLSLTNLNIALDEATEEDLRRAQTRLELIPLLLEGFELMGMLSKFWRSFRRRVDDPSFQALLLVFLVHLVRQGYAENIDELLKTYRWHVPRLRAFQTLYLALLQELPTVAKVLGPPEKLWKKIQDLPVQEREHYLAQKNEQIHTAYLQHQAELDAFWQQHASIKQILEEDAPSSLSVPE